MRKKYIKICTNITYYGEWRLKWWQKLLFYRPPRKVISTAKKMSSNRALRMRIIDTYTCCNMEFEVCSYKATTRRIA